MSEMKLYPYLLDSTPPLSSKPNIFPLIPVEIVKILFDSLTVSNAISDSDAR